MNENDVDSGIALKATDHTDYFGFKNIKICDFRKNFGVFFKEEGREKEARRLQACSMPLRASFESEEELELFFRMQRLGFFQKRIF